MKSQFWAIALSTGIAIAAVVAPTRTARAQEAEVVTTVGREIVDALGNDAAEFGGDAMARQTAERLMAQATEAAGSAGSKIAKSQLERILASRQEALIFDLKSISGNSLPLLEDISDQGLPSAVATLARPGVEDGIESLGSIALRKAALAGETRLPGAGLKLVEHYGPEGADLATTLTEDQANGAIAALRPNAINALPAAERRGLLSALASRPDARVFNLAGTTGPLVVVAAGVVLWHGIDVALAPDERVTELPDGTVIREKTSVGSMAMQSIPSTARELAGSIKWIGIAGAAGISLVLGVTSWWRRRSRVGSP